MGDGRRAINDGNDMLDFDPNWKDNLWFYEFFDGDTGRGLGASHQCGWTGLMAKMIHDTGVNCRLPQTPRTPTTAAAHYFDDIWSKTRKGGPRPLRRSSTHRNLGFGGASSNGDHTHGDEEDLKKKAEVDSRVASYVSDQLERMRSNDSANANAIEDEIETKFDGADERTNGH